MKKYEEQARKFGFTHAVFLDDLALECKPELRSYCNPEQCPNHGHNWVCPPACGTLESCQQKALGFRQGLLLQSISDLGPSTTPETYQALTRDHNLRLQKLVEAIHTEVAELMPLSTGGCILCDTCSYPAPCVHPELKMESLSAFGIDVGEVCRNAGLAFSFCQDKLYLTALVMMK